MLKRRIETTNTSKIGEQSAEISCFRIPILICEQMVYTPGKSVKI